MRRLIKPNWLITIFLLSYILNYFYFSKRYLMLIPIGICAYEAVLIFGELNLKKAHKIIALIATALAVLCMGGIYFIMGLENPAFMFILFVIANLFFIYILISYLQNKKVSLSLLIVSWVICCIIPIGIIGIVFAFLEARGKYN